MITDYIGGEGSAETPKNDYVIYGWPLIGQRLPQGITSPGHKLPSIKVIRADVQAVFLELHPSDRKQMKDIELKRKTWRDGERELVSKNHHCICNHLNQHALPHHVRCIFFFFFFMCVIIICLSRFCSFLVFFCLPLYFCYVFFSPSWNMIALI